MEMVVTHSNKNYKSIITFTETNVNYSTNTSDIDYVVKMQTSNNYYFEKVGTTIVIKLDGLTKVDSYAQRTVSKNSTTVLLTGTITGVPHNDDGSKSVSLSYDFSHSSTASWMPGSGSGTQSMTLTTIPRKTSANYFSGVIEKSTNISINPASSSFKHSFKLTFGSNTKWLNSSGGLSTSEAKLSGSSFSFNVPSEYYSQFAGSFKSGTLQVNTYSGDTLIGTDTANFDISIDSGLCVPNVTGTLVDILQKTINLTGNSNKLIKGYSTGKLTISSIRTSSSNDNGASITELKIAGVSVPTSTRTREFLNINVQSVDVYVKNSRGVSKTFTISANSLINYIPLTLNALFKRKTQTGSEITLNYSGNYFNNSFGNTSNSLSLSWAYKKKTESSYTSGGTLTPTISNNTYSGTISCGTSYPYTEAYDFIIYYSDKLISSQYRDEVTKGVPLIAIFQDGSLLFGGEFIGIEVVSES